MCWTILRLVVPVQAVVAVRVAPLVGLRRVGIQAGHLPGISRIRMDTPLPEPSTAAPAVLDLRRHRLARRDTEDDH